MAPVEVVAVGDELLLGAVLDTNTSWLGRRLAEAGAGLSRATLVPDQVDAIRSVLAEAVARRPAAVVVTGGLGPTSDDRTRDALAALGAVALRRDPGLEDGLAEWYAARGRELPELARGQADVPEGARVLPNPVGSAPGLVLVVDGVAVWALPGVPAEMVVLAERYLLPELADPADVAVLRVLAVARLGESDIATRLAPLEEELPAGVALAYLPEVGEVRLRLSARGPGAAELLAPWVERARASLGLAVYGSGQDRLEAVVVRLLAEAGASLAAAESLTGGGVGAALTAVPGSSAVFRGGVVAYAAELKHRLLGVPAGLLERHGPVSAEVAAAMAAGVRDRLGARYGVATTGVAGPDRQDGHPPGTVHLAVAGPGGTVTASPLLPGDRERVRRLSVVHVLDLLRLELQAQP